MKLWGIDENELDLIIRTVSRDSYDGNLTPNRLDRVNSRCVAFTLRVNSSKDAGARRSASGRRSVAACWHAHRDVMVAIFDRNPAARISSSFADYRGQEGFQRDFPETGSHNVGSMMSPMAIADCCDCEDAPAMYRRHEPTYAPPAPSHYSPDAFRWSPKAGEDEMAKWADIIRPNA